MFITTDDDDEEHVGQIAVTNHHLCLFTFLASAKQVELNALPE